ncbi:filamentous hemagglutinin N-terminal domain-containing protein [Synechococcus sp. PCC 7336]|uniref:two-partner secretion domain-containing protein n=1 Tax=Synechococcus sp. PCC 7336 TaxID=195250 RepID=UPI000349D8D4|nr:filamentous hemagglutinin N-terminal domain-containing protein [Synechococcus sp. PCC 7336]
MADGSTYTNVDDNMAGNCVGGCLVTGNTVIGINQFHSFTDFSVPTGEAVVFDTSLPAGIMNNIQNIISRVTGNSVSNIDGSISTIGPQPANLFLINPNGISFGPNALLNVQGAFVGTTASAIEFGSQGVFSALDSSEPAPMLAINPTALIFNQLPQVGSMSPQLGSINVENNLLIVNPDSSLLLIGGEVNINNNLLISRLPLSPSASEAPGQIAFGAIGTGGGRVELQSQFGDNNYGTAPFAQFENVLDGGNISLLNSNISEFFGGDVVVFGGSIDVMDVQITQGESSEGNIDLNARDSISIIDSPQGLETNISSIASDTDDAGSISFYAGNEIFLQGNVIISADSSGGGNSGEISFETSLETGSIIITDGVTISANAAGVGTSAGEISIQAREVTLSGIDIDTSSIGNAQQAGAISIFGKSLNLTEGASISSQTAGDAITPGNIEISVNHVSLSGGSEISTQRTSGTGIGDAGEISITGNALSLSENSVISSETQTGTGEGGNISLAVDRIDLTNGTITAETTGPGNAGTIDLHGNLLRLNDRSTITSSTSENGGLGGSIDIDVANTRLTGDSTVAASTAGASNAGDINLTGNRLALLGGSTIETSTSAAGDAGDISIHVKEDLLVRGTDPAGNPSGIFANTTAGSTGSGGSISIKSEDTSLFEQASIAVDSLGDGDAGALHIVSGDLTLDTGSSISAATASGEGGDLSFNIHDLLLLRRNSNITTEAGNDGNGGDIDIEADFIVGIPGEDVNIIANAFEGDGGNITLTAFSVLGFTLGPDPAEANNISASSELGVDGDIIIDVLDTDPARGLEERQVQFSDLSNLIGSTCNFGSPDDEQSQFILAGRGGLSPDPNEPLTGEALIERQWVTRPDNLASTSTLSTPPPNQSIRQTEPRQRIVEAQGWYVNAAGQVVLTANPIEVSSQVVTSAAPSTCLSPS